MAGMKDLYQLHAAAVGLERRLDLVQGFLHAFLEHLVPLC